MESILDAAEQLIAEVGYAEATTNAVAARAGVSPGSLYQYYRNKEDLLGALLDRYRTQFRNFWDVALEGAQTLDREELVDRILDAVLEFKATRPAFWELLHGSATTAELAAVSRELHEEHVHRLTAVFTARAPEQSEARCALVASLLVATVRGVVPLVLGAATEREAQETVAELKLLAASYLRDAL